MYNTCINKLLKYNMSRKTKSFELKKIIIFTFLFLFVLPVMAAEYTWQDIDGACFEKYASANIEEEQTVKMNLFTQSSLLFVQNEKILPYKYFQDLPDSFLDYRVLELNGIKQNEDSQPTSINDNNISTEFLFNTIDALEKNIIIDAGVYLERETFSLTLIYNNGEVYEALYSISDDGISYVNVADPVSYSFRYLKIVFNKILDDDKIYPLSLGELNIKTKGKKIVLVNSNGFGRVDVFSNYHCKDGKMTAVLNKIKTDSYTTVFKTDINTPEFDLDFLENEKYDSDLDKDGILNNIDNCPYISNADQADLDNDMLGDLCDLDEELKNFNEKDTDNDRVGDSQDNCPLVYNPKQKDSNANGRGDLCSDDDRDGIVGINDNCVYVSNRDQKDVNANKVGDACEFDKDRDGIFDSIDNCVNTSNYSQLDSDKDGIGDLCDNCGIYNPQQLDRDANEIGDKCEEREEYIIKNDDDGDTILNNLDNCRNVQNFRQEDRDGDRVGDACDNCIQIKNTDQKDVDENGIGDMCDDADGDGVLGYLDNCPGISNVDQSDIDNDGVGDLCGDTDRDRVLNANDNCEYDYNPKQSDVDRDGIGDKCDEYDGRIVESNKTLFKVFIGVVTLVFASLIFFMISKMRKEESGDNSDWEKENNDKLT